MIFVTFREKGTKEVSWGSLPYLFFSSTKPDNILCVQKEQQNFSALGKELQGVLKETKACLKYALMYKQSRNITWYYSFALS